MAEVKMSTPDKAEDEELEVEDLEEDEDLESDEIEEVFQALADADPETEIWTDGPTAGQMIEWMDQHKNVYVTSISFDEHVAWRPLKRSEYAKISSHLESLPVETSETEANMINEELICKTCVLAPDYSKQDFDDLLAGVPTLIAQQIMERSGFTAIGLREMV